MRRSGRLRREAIECFASFNARALMLFIGNTSIGQGTRRKKPDSLPQQRMLAHINDFKGTSCGLFPTSIFAARRLTDPVRHKPARPGAGSLTVRDPEWCQKPGVIMRSAGVMRNSYAGRLRFDRESSANTFAISCSYSRRETGANTTLSPGAERSRDSSCNKRYGERPIKCQTTGVSFGKTHVTSSDANRTAGIFGRVSLVLVTRVQSVGHHICLPEGIRACRRDR